MAARGTQGQSLVPLLLCFKVSIHLLALCCVHISKTPALGQKPWEVDTGKESGLTVQARPLALQYSARPVLREPPRRRRLRARASPREESS